MAFVLLIVGGLCLSVVAEYATDPVRALSKLSYHDYLADIRKLRQEGKQAEALQLAQYVSRNPDFPNQDLIAAEIEDMKTKESPVNRIKRGIVGFLTGRGESAEEMGGAMVSDLLLGGDLRDVIAHLGGFDGKDADPFVEALRSVSGLTAQAQTVDWSPSLLKILRKSDSVSQPFENWLMSEIKKSLQKGDLTPELASALQNSARLAQRIGLPRMRSTFQAVDTPEDLAAFTALAEKNSDTAYLIVKNGGMELLRRQKGQFDSKSLELLKLAANKGPEGVAVLLKPSFKLSRLLSRLHQGVSWDRFSDAVGGGMEAILAGIRNNSVMVWIPVLGAFVSFGGSVMCFKSAFRKKSPNPANV